jgi:hypothetical protein
VGARFDDRITGNLDKFCPYSLMWELSRKAANTDSL